MHSFRVGLAVALFLFLLSPAILAQEVVKQKEDSVVDDEQLDHNDADPVDAEQIIQIEGAGTPGDTTDDKWAIHSALFEPPDNWAFKPFDGTTDDYVDIIPRRIDGFDADADPENASQIRVIWFAKSLPDSADSFALKAEGNLKPPSGGSGPPPKDWHWSVAVLTPLIDIDTDIDRDGDVDEDDEPGEESVGTIVMANKEVFGGARAYHGGDDTALRRKVVLSRNHGSGDIRVARSGDSVELYGSESGGDELFGAANEITLSPGTYWLQGGETPSAATRDQHLKIREDDDNATYFDQINITVLWVVYSGDATATNQIKQSPIYDKHNDLVTRILGQADLGVQILSGTGVTSNQRFMNGVAMFTGTISPSDLKSKFDTKITTGHTDAQGGGADPQLNKPNGATFGFVHRRIVDGHLYKNGKLANKIDSKTGNDDSYTIYQDVDPDKDGNDLVVIDVDAPGKDANPASRPFVHTRMNFTQYQVFHFYKDVPEVCSNILEWSVSMDHAFSTNSKAVAIFDARNDGNGTNEVNIGSTIDITDLNLPGPPNMTSALTKNANDKKLPVGVSTKIVVKGTNLVGEFTLKKAGQTTIQAKAVAVKRTGNNFSDLTEVEVAFKPDAAAPVGGGWELHYTNDVGSSVPIGGFEIVP